MGYCNCCAGVGPDQVCSTCFTNLVWDANFTGTYRDVERGYPQHGGNNLPSGKDWGFTQDVIAVRFYDNIWPDDATTGGCSELVNGVGDCQTLINGCSYSGFPSSAYLYYKVENGNNWSQYYQLKASDIRTRYPFVDFTNPLRVNSESVPYITGNINNTGYFELPRSSALGGSRIGTGFIIPTGRYFFSNTSDSGIFGSFNLWAYRDHNKLSDPTQPITGGSITDGICSSNAGLPNPFSFFEGSGSYTGVYRQYIKHNFLTRPNIFGLYLLNFPKILDGTFYKEYESTTTVHRMGSNQDWDDGKIIEVNSPSFIGGVTGSCNYFRPYSAGFTQILDFGISTLTSHKFDIPDINLNISVEVDAVNPTLLGKAKYLPYGGYVVNADGLSNTGRVFNDSRLLVEGFDPNNYRDYIGTKTFRDIKNSPFRVQISSSGKSPCLWDSGINLFTGLFEVSLNIPELSYSKTVDITGRFSRCDVGFANVIGSMNTFKTHSVYMGKDNINEDYPDAPYQGRYQQAMTSLGATFIDRVLLNSFGNIVIGGHLANQAFVPQFINPELPVSGVSGSIYNYQGTLFSLDNLTDLIDDMNSRSNIPQYIYYDSPPISPCSTTGDGGVIVAEYTPAGGVVTSIQRLKLEFDDQPIPGLVVDEVEYQYRDSTGLITGTQILTATGDYGSYTIPNNETMVLTGLPKEYDTFIMKFDNYGITGATITGTNLDPSGGTPTGILQSVSPITGIIPSYQTGASYFEAYTGLNSGYYTGSWHTQIELLHEYDGGLIDNPYYFNLTFTGGLGQDTGMEPEVPL